VSEISLRRGLASDIDFCMTTERLPGYDVLTACWTEVEHLRALELVDTRYLVGGYAAGPLFGFAIVERVNDPHEGAKLKRIAVTQPAVGFGVPFLRAVIGWVFESTAAPRLWLDVFVHNARARHVYRKVGMREDGLLRQAYVQPNGERVDRVIMSVLRTEWS
jgi:ribosomal protein S18 acetylase RimI-like enzyme